MKVIDLMQMYVNKEVLPKKIIIQDNQLYDEDTIWEHKSNSFYCREYNGDTQFLFEYIIPEMLNDEIEIIEDTPKEDKKIEKFYFSVYQDQKLGGREVVEPLETKINEIIDYINKEVKNNE